MIAILLLIGIVKKNAIMMIDFELATERDQGLGSTDAMPQAAGKRFRSTGLGLAVVKSIAQLHGATMTVDSLVGAGSAFTTHFPRAPAARSLQST